MKRKEWGDVKVNEKKRMRRFKSKRKVKEKKDEKKKKRKKKERKRNENECEEKMKVKWICMILLARARALYSFYFMTYWALGSQMLRCVGDELELAQEDYAGEDGDCARTWDVRYSWPGAHYFWEIILRCILMTCF